MTGFAARMGEVPLQGRYRPAVAMALLALCPFIVLSTASLMFEHQLTEDLGTSTFGVQLAAGLANAGYAFGAVAAADLNQRLTSRRLYLASEAAFACGSLVAAFAPDITVFTIGRVIQGTSTGVLLVAALPPLITNHGAAKLPLTAAFVNLGLFGVVTLGPTAGGVVAAFSAWRPLFVAVAVLGVAGLVLGVLAFDRTDPANRGMGFDFSAIPVAATATVLPFVGVAWLAKGSFTAPGFLIPLTAGLAALGVLIVRQYRKPQALMPLKLLAHTLPVTGVSAAMIAGAGFTTFVELATVYLLDAAHVTPMAAGGLLATQLAGIAVAAWGFKRVLTTRWLPLFAFCGVAVVAAGGAVLLAVGPGSTGWPILVAGLLLGFGAGAGVSPGLFMGGLSVPSDRLGPTFALVELLRSEAAFLIGPVLLQLAMSAKDLASGVHLATVIMMALVLVIGGALGLLLLLGGKRPHAPDLSSWLDGAGSAYDSPPLAAVLRDNDA